MTADTSARLRPPGSAVVGICLDLNIWVADLLATKKGRVDTAGQTLVNVVRAGSCGLGPTQLVISWGMLDRLHLVITREFAVTPELATTCIEHRHDRGDGPIRHPTLFSAGWDRSAPASRSRGPRGSRNRIRWAGPHGSMHIGYAQLQALSRQGHDRSGFREARHRAAGWSGGDCCSTKRHA